jgi:methyl-accepting chemotaxis protein
MMRQFANLKIIWKIMLPAALLAAIVGIIAWLALSALSSMNTSVARVLDESAQKVFLANSASFNVNSTTTDDREVVLAKSKADLEKAAKQFDEDLVAGRKPLADLLKLETMSERRTKIATIEKQIDEFEKIDRRAFDLARTGKMEDAYALIAGDAFKMYSQAMDGLAEIVKLEQDDIAIARGKIASDISATLWTVMVTSAVGFLFGFGSLGAVGLLQISRPIGQITSALRLLAGGDLAVAVTDSDRHDEVGQIAAAAQTFKDALIAKKAAEETASADAETKLRRAQRVDDLTRQFEAMITKMVGALSASSTELEAAAGTLTKTAEMAREQSGSVAAAAEQASSNVQSVASATEEMTSSVSEISRQVQESSDIANQAVKQAQKTDERINQLSQAAGRIGDVVRLITAIAEQTNLLALNATIEAARAGEAGKGFAVVAQEVKALAAQTAKATDEIGGQIAGMQTATADSVAAIKEIGATIARISDIARMIAQTVDEQGAATKEIARSVHEAARGTSQVAGSIAEVTRGAGETGAASAQVLASAESLAQESGHLKIEVDKFLSDMRAA